MTGPDRANTAAMQTAAEAIKTAHQKLRANAQQIQENTDRLVQGLEEQGMQEGLKRTSAQWQQSNEVLQEKLLALGTLIGVTASDIDKLTAQGHAMLRDTGRKIDTA